MYERSNPYDELRRRRHARHDRSAATSRSDERTTRITGPRFVPSDGIRVKLEGAGKVGERFVGMVGIRDPYTIANVDEVIGWAREQVRERFGDTGYELTTPSTAATA